MLEKSNVDRRATFVVGSADDAEGEEEVSQDGKREERVGTGEVVAVDAGPGTGFNEAEGDVARACSDVEGVSSDDLPYASAGAMVLGVAATGRGAAETILSFFSISFDSIAALVRNLVARSRFSIDLARRSSSTSPRVTASERHRVLEMLRALNAPPLLATTGAARVGDEVASLS